VPCSGHASLPSSPLVSPYIKRRSRWPSAPGALILVGAELNATAGRKLLEASREAAMSAQALRQKTATAGIAPAAPRRRDPGAHSPLIREPTAGRMSVQPIPLPQFCGLRIQ
jgi:hypothetical protein